MTGYIVKGKLTMMMDCLTVIDEAEIAIAIQTDARNIDRLAERAYCRDYSRLGLGSLTGPQQRTRTDPFRLTLANSSYTICRRWAEINQFITH